MKFSYQVVVKRGYASEVFGDFEHITEAKYFAEMYVSKIMDKDNDGDELKPLTDCYIRIKPIYSVGIEEESEVSEKC